MSWSHDFRTELIEHAVSRRPALRNRLRSSEVGRLINELRAIAQASQADYLVTGDKSGLLALARYEATNIITARAFVESVLKLW